MTHDQTFDRLQNWYLSQCDGDWEHSFGIKIDTLDNPGWSITIDLQQTPLENRTFPEVELQGDEENDWLHARKDGLTFFAFCGPQNLEEAFIVFLDWADQVVGDQEQ